MNPDDAIMEYCRIESRLKQSRRESLKLLGITEDGLKKLHDNALTLMGDSELIETEYGKLQKKYDKPTQFVVREGKPNWKKKLHLTLKEEN